MNKQKTPYFFLHSYQPYCISLISDSGVDDKYAKVPIIVANAEATMKKKKKKIHNDNKQSFVFFPY